MFFYEIFSSVLEYMPQPCAKATNMRPAVSYIPYATYSRGKTGDIITFAHFKGGYLSSETRNLLSVTRDNTESGNGYDDNLTLSPLISG